VRRSYRHVGIAGPRYPLRDLTDEELASYVVPGVGKGAGYVKYEPYPEGGRTLGRYWTQEQLDSIGKGCRTVTTMGQEIAETYAAKPFFYGATYCCGCSRHLPVGAAGEFTWINSDGTDSTERVGT
jgi:hypothetical protein